MKDLLWLTRPPGIAPEIQKLEKLLASYQADPKLGDSNEVMDVSH